MIDEYFPTDVLPVKKWPHQNDAALFYGNPTKGNVAGEHGPCPVWEANNLTRVSTPWTLYMAQDDVNAPLLPRNIVRGIRIHKRCASSLLRVLSDIWETSNRNEHLIQEWGMHLFGGGYHYRLMRGSNRLSMHSYGCAVDFDPVRNAMRNKNPRFAHIPAVLRAFEREEWVWLGMARVPDGMHWQAARIEV